MSTFIDEAGALQCLMEVDESSVPGHWLVALFATASLRICPSATASMSNTTAPENKLKAGEKKVMEVSLVRKGAREGCHITAWDAGNGLFQTRAD